MSHIHFFHSAIANNRKYMTLHGVSESQMSQYFALMNEKTCAFITTLQQFPLIEPTVTEHTLDTAMSTLTHYQRYFTHNMKLHWEPVRTMTLHSNSKGDPHFLKVIRAHQKKTCGFILPNLEPYIVIPQLFGALWSGVFEITSVESHVSNLTKETLQAAVSYINKCTYCEELHTTLSMGMGLSYSMIHPLIRGKSVKMVSGLVTPKLVNIVSWGRVSNVKDHPLVKSPPFSEEDAAEVFGTAFLMHYFNRISNSFLKKFTKAKGTFLKSHVLHKMSESTKAVKDSKRVPGMCVCV